jgi:hypothetical protein
MARPPRIVVPNGIYRVSAHGNRGQALFTDEQDYRQYVRFLRDVAAAHGWLCQSYWLLPDRVSFVVQTPVPNLSQGMQRLQTRYAQWFNRRHGFAGHLFDGRFRSVLIEVGHVMDAVRELIAIPVVALGLALRWGRPGLSRAVRRGLQLAVTSAARPPP